MRACPFCKSGEFRTIPVTDSWTEAKNYRVVCEICDAMGPIAKTAEQAEKKWDGYLANIKDNRKFKEALEEGYSPKPSKIILAPRDLFDTIMNIFADKVSAGIFYEDDEYAVNELVNLLKNKKELYPQQLYDLTADLEWADGTLGEEDNEVFTEYLWSALTGEDNILDTKLSSSSFVK